LTRTLGGWTPLRSTVGRRRADHPPPAAPQSPQDLGHGKAGRYRQRVALNGHRDGRALQQPASAAATAAASSHSSSHARRVSRSQADQGEGVPTRTPGGACGCWSWVEPVAPAANDPMTEAGAISAYLLRMVPTGKSATSRREHGAMRSAPHGSPGPWRRHR
jgi:hypothetical protein